MTVKKAGNVTKALKLLDLTGSNAKAMEKLLKEHALANTSQRAGLIDKMENFAKEEQIKAALKNAGLS